MQIPETDFFKTFLEISWNQTGVFLLSQGGDDELLIPNSLKRSLETVMHDGQVNFGHSQFLTRLNFMVKPGWVKRFFWPFGDNIQWSAFGFVV